MQCFSLVSRALPHQNEIPTLFTYRQWMRHFNKWIASNSGRARWMKGQGENARFSLVSRALDECWQDGFSGDSATRDCHEEEARNVGTKEESAMAGSCLNVLVCGL